MSMEDIREKIMYFEGWYKEAGGQKWEGPTNNASSTEIDGLEIHSWLSSWS